MNERMIGWMREWMNERMDGWENGWENGWMNEWTVSTPEWLTEVTLKWMSEWMDEWENGWMREWMDENGWMREWWIMINKWNIKGILKLHNKNYTSHFWFKLIEKQQSISIGTAEKKSSRSIV